MTATWADVEAAIKERDGRERFREARHRIYYVPSPTGGTFSVEVTLRPRWCSLAVDRWRTTDRVEESATVWFEANVWPHVREACGLSGRSGVLPTGGGSYASAHPIERTVLLPVVTAWIGAELTWGLPPTDRRKAR